MCHWVGESCELEDHILWGEIPLIWRLQVCVCVGGFEALCGCMVIARLVARVL